MAKNKNINNHFKFDELHALEKIHHSGLFVECNILMPELDHLTRHFRSDFFQIMLVNSGSGEVNINLRDYKVKYRDFLTTGPYDIKKVNNTDNCRHSLVLFTGDFIRDSGINKYANELLHIFTSGMSPKNSLKYEDYKTINNKIAAVHNLYVNESNHIYGKELLYLSFTSLLFEIAAISQKYSKTVNSPISRKEHIVLTFVNLVKDNFREHRNLSFYASQLNITPKYLTETTKAISGKSAALIIEGIVNEEAMMLLDNPSLSIGEISYMLNFSDQSFFGKFFKRGVGVSPKNYRSSRR